MNDISPCKFSFKPLSCNINTPSRFTFDISCCNKVKTCQIISLYKFIISLVSL